MPFLLVHSLPCSPEQKKNLIKKLTEAICSIYQIKPDIVTVYISEFANENYGHAGRMGPETPEKRVFIQVHAFERPLEKKRALVKRIAETLSGACGISIADVAVYIFDSDEQNVSHGGVLFADAEGTP